MRIGIVFLVAVAVVATAVLHAAEAVEIPVGGDSGWRNNPPNPTFYSSWAAGENFTVGDVLVFTFSTGGHDVAGVTKADYDSCNTGNTKFVNSTSPFSFTLDTADDVYFICTVPGHCSSGQKLAVTNIQQPSSSTAPPPPPASPDTPPVSGDQPPASPDSPPASGDQPPASPDSPPLSGDQPPPPPTVTPPPPNSASTTLASIFTVAFVCVAVTLMMF